MGGHEGDITNGPSIKSEDSPFQMNGIETMDLVQIETEPAMDQPSHQDLMSNHQDLMSIGEVKISKSKNVHIGTDIRAENLTIIQNFPRPTKTKPSIFPSDKTIINCGSLTLKDQEIEENKNEEDVKGIGSLSKRTRLILLCVILGVTALVIVIVLVWKFDYDRPHPHKNHTIVTTTPASLPTTSQRPPQDWYINVTQWSLKNFTHDRNYASQEKTMLAIDNEVKLDECYTLATCVQLLRDLQDRMPGADSINYNYLIGGDGRAYEVRGNNRPADSSIDYSLKFIKLGFMGKYEGNVTLGPLQIDVLWKLIEKLKGNGQLTNNYQVVAQCCRNIPRENGPSPSIIQFLLRTFINKIDPHCVCVNRFVTTTTAPPQGILGFW